MSRIDDSIDVNVPVRTAYDQWTQFESFPQFMDGVEKVDQVDDTSLAWTASIAGRTKTWQARIVDQTPDARVSWEATEGAMNRGSVTFDSLGPAITRVNLALEYEPEGPIESAGDALGIVERRVKGDLRRFKEFIEARGSETGGWRGTVQNGSEVSSR